MRKARNSDPRRLEYAQREPWCRTCEWQYNFILPCDQMTNLLQLMTYVGPDGERSTAESYLSDEVLKRPNLTVVTGVSRWPDLLTCSFDLTLHLPHRPTSLE